MSDRRFTVAISDGQLPSVLFGEMWDWQIEIPESLFPGNVEVIELEIDPEVIVANFSPLIDHINGFVSAIALGDLVPILWLTGPFNCYGIIPIINAVASQNPIPAFYCPQYEHRSSGYDEIESWFSFECDAEYPITLPSHEEIDWDDLHGVVLCVPPGQVPKYVSQPLGDLELQEMTKDRVTICEFYHHFAGATLLVPTGRSAEVRDTLTASLKELGILREP